MGQAKRRGSRDERAANPNPKPDNSLSEADLQVLRTRMRETVRSFRKQLFSPFKTRQKKPRQTRTGG